MNLNRPTGTDAEHLEAAQAWLHLGNVLEADKELDEITLHSRAHPDVLQVRLGIYSKLEKWDGAVHIITALISHRPNRVENWIQKSQILEKQGRSEESRNNIRAALNEQAWGVDDLYALASEAEKLHHSTEAIECIKVGVGKTGFEQLKALVLATDMMKTIHPQIQNLTPSKP